MKMGRNSMVTGRSIYRSINNEPRDYEAHSHTLKDFSLNLNESGDRAYVTTEIVATVGNTEIPQKIAYTVYPDGSIDVNAGFSTPEKFELPRLGLRSIFNEALENIEWFGRGPIENYPDRKAADFVGLYNYTVEDMREHYVHSQSMGTRTDTRWLTLKDNNGNGIKVTPFDGLFDFTALHYTDEDIWNVKYGHDLDNVRCKETILNIDCATRGLGSASCGPGPRLEFRLSPDSTYTSSFRISPI